MRVILEMKDEKYLQRRAIEFLRENETMDEAIPKMRQMDNLQLALLLIATILAERSE